MKRTLTSLVVAVGLVAAACGGDGGATPQRSTTTTSVPGDGPIELLSGGDMKGLMWWEPVPAHGLVVYAAESTPGEATVVAVDAGGDRIVLAEDLPVAATTRVAPGGGFLAVAEPQPGRGWAVWTVPTSGGEPQTLVRAEHRLALGAFTPDSQTLLYRVMAARPSLHAVATDGSDPITLARAGSDEVDPVMGPPTLVGDHAVFATFDETEGVRVWSAQIDRPGRIRLPFPEGLRTVWQITAAADGRHALVEAEVRGLSSPRALYAVWSDGRGPAVLLDEGAELGVADVSADGDAAVYRIGGDRYSTGLWGTSPQLLVEPAVAVPGFPFVDEPVVAPGGGFVFMAALDSPQRELYHFDPSSDTVARLNGDLEEHPGVLGGESTDWVLDFEILGDGRHVAYTTGLAGRSADVPYRLYIAPLP